MIHTLPPPPRWALPVIGATLALGAFLRILHLASDLPFIYNPDEHIFLDAAIRLLDKKTLDPGWYGHPGQFTIYLLASAFSVLYAVCRLLGLVSGYASFIAWYNYEPSVFYLIGRIISATFSVGCLLLVALIVRRLAVSGATIALAVFLVAINPLLIGHGFVIRTDNQLTFFALLVCLFSIRIAETGNQRDYLLAGAALGVAISCKYPAIIFAVAIITAHAVVHEGRLWQQGHRLLLSGAAALMATFISGPYLFLNTEGMIRDVLVESVPYKLGHTADGALDSSVWYFDKVLRTSGGYVGLVLFLMGVGVAAWRPYIGRRVIALTAIAFFIFIVQLNLVWTRWLIPFVPLYVILLALGLEDIFFFAKRRYGKLALGIAAGLSITVLANPVLSLDGTFRKPKPELTKGYEWIVRNLPEGSQILLEQYTPQLPGAKYTLWKVSSRGNLIPLVSERKYVASTGIVGTLKDLGELKRKGIDFLVLGSSYYPAMKREKTRYRTEVARYEELFRSYPTVFKNGKVRVLRIKGSD